MSALEMTAKIKRMNRDSEISNFPAQLAIPEQAHYVVFNAIVQGGLTQHGDQMGLRTSGSKFVNDVNVTHGQLERRVGEYFGISGTCELPQAHRVRNNSNGYLQK